MFVCGVCVCVCGVFMCVCVCGVFVCVVCVCVCGVFVWGVCLCVCGVFVCGVCVFCVCAVHILRCAYVNKYCQFAFSAVLVRC